MTDETKPTTSGSVKRRQRKPFDAKRDLRERLNRFLDNPTNPASLQSLVSGMVGYELNARLLRVLPPA
ncbi:hypothetical protein [Ralstonia pseudosolanacearum]|uniref:hypothetical protein n=1 Tax=Ralstonia pseudosolanacearum TaxID=1310165 RepID=UPI000AEFE0FA|nr:hypothetical protein [Ralstonia pseudosolanacearum]MDO3576654.1 hypothetical protein [Ralstonia pseudosolanacearum]MDO3588974.1 hypothetical protein [Ralstonia pseudosolanacearum]